MTSEIFLSKILRNRTNYKNTGVQSYGKVINRISNRLRRRSAALQETLGMSGAQGNILNFILVEGQKHSIYQKDIEKEFGLRPSTATEVLKALEKKELICRVSEKQDARLKRIEFTSKAEEIRHLIAAERRVGKHFIKRYYRRRKADLYSNRRANA